jgi:hypothetical protein
MPAGRAESRHQQIAVRAAARDLLREADGRTAPLPKERAVQVKPPYQGWIVGVANQHVVLAEVNRKRAVEIRADKGLLPVPSRLNRWMVFS